VSCLLETICLHSIDLSPPSPPQITPLPTIYLIMAKRSWNQVDGAATQPASRRLSSKNATQNTRIKPGSPGSPNETKLFQRNGSFSDQRPPTPSLTDAGSEPRSAKSTSGGSRQRAASLAQSDDNDAIMWPSITRKVKACAACRKQKVGFFLWSISMH
jgi:hypothetical protein